MKWLLLVSCVAAVAVPLHRLALWAEARGWIYYRKAGRGGSLGTALLEMQALVEPPQRHVVEERLREDSEQDESGDKIPRRRTR
jgi:hypothetical protein